VAAAWGHEADDLRWFVEHDPLRDEGNALAQQLRDLGVEVQHVPHSGLVHGFLGLNHVAEAGRDLSIGSATSFAAVQLCRPTERAPLKDRLAGSLGVALPWLRHRPEKRVASLRKSPSRRCVC